MWFRVDYCCFGCGLFVMFGWVCGLVVGEFLIFVNAYYVITWCWVRWVVGLLVWLFVGDLLLMVTVIDLGCLVWLMFCWVVCIEVVVVLFLFWCVWVVVYRCLVRLGLVLV